MVDELLAGHGRFRAEYATAEREFLTRLAEEGQRPSALFVGCSDSRVIPELLTDAAPGELFVVRNVANQVPVHDDPDKSVAAAIEFAVGQLGVHEVIICGHDGCGGVKAAFDGLSRSEPNSDLAGWLHGLLPSIERARAFDPDRSVQLRRAVEENVLDGIANLMTFPTILTAVAAGQVRLHGWVYELHEATLRVFDAEHDGFVDVDRTAFKARS
jgi:carbonic anhydrase